MTLAPPLAQTLAQIARAAAGASDQWWVIGSAAVALHGVAQCAVNDVDLLMSPRDAAAFLRSAGIATGEPQPSDRFRSQIFGIWTAPPLPVDIFAGFAVAVDGEWHEVRLSTRIAVPVGDATLYVPERRDLIVLLHLFGRPKDLERAALLG